MQILCILDLWTPSISKLLSMNIFSDSFLRKNDSCTSKFEKAHHIRVFVSWREETNRPRRVWNVNTSDFVMRHIVVDMCVYKTVSHLEKMIKRQIIPNINCGYLSIKIKLDKLDAIFFFLTILTIYIYIATRETKRISLGIS